MPRMNGLDLIRQIRSEQGRRLPTVVVSARGTDEDKRRAADDDANRAERGTHLMIDERAHRDLPGLTRQCMPPPLCTRPAQHRLLISFISFAARVAAGFRERSVD
jgi:CheY-like chemotaxis protein